MKNITIYIIILVLIIVVGFFLFNNKKGDINTTPTTQAPSNEMVDCGTMEDPSCFMNRMNNCSPVTGKLTGNDGTSIELIILGQENEKCHFQRKVNGTMDLNCLFPKGTMN
ncbi:MAG: hypothetical protein WC483_02020 [Candidatus Paceibacterota bacterium]|jgi:uncharacterized protein (UPF0333 family)|nr:hypothetical protein [Candidatus Paceibacterota bacterium]